MLRPSFRLHANKQHKHYSAVTSYNSTEAQKVACIKKKKRKKQQQLLALIVAKTNLQVCVPYLAKLEAENVAECVSS